MNSCLAFLGLLGIYQVASMGITRFDGLDVDNNALYADGVIVVKNDLDMKWWWWW